MNLTAEEVQNEHFKVGSNGVLLTKSLPPGIDRSCSFTEEEKINIKFPPLLIFLPFLSVGFLRTAAALMDAEEEEEEMPTGLQKCSSS